MKTNKRNILSISLLLFTFCASAQNLLVTTDSIGNLLWNDSIPEIVVKADKRYMKMKDGNLLIQVKDSPLSQEHSVNDMFERLPGINVSASGALNIVGLGKPEIYINSRKVNSDEEWKNLDIKNIKNVEMLFNPGAKYGANVNSVLLITTYHPDEGFFSTIKGSYKRNDTNTNSESVTLGWVDKRWNISVYYGYDDNRYNVRQPQSHLITYEDGSEYYSQTKRTASDITFMNQGMANMEFNLNEKHTIGTSWDGAWSSGGRKENSEMIYIFPERNFILNSHGMQHADDKSHHINLFHIGKWSNRFQSELYADYAYSSNKINQPVYENEDDTNILTNMKSNSRYSIYAAKWTGEWKVWNNNRLSFGADISSVKGNGGTECSNDYIESSEYKNSENKIAAYIQWNTKFNDHLSAQAGLRYEHIGSSFTDKVNTDKNIEKDYSNIFPSISISYRGADIMHTISLVSKTSRPSFSQLSNATYYVNRYFYQVGDPALKPQQTYRLSWSSSYRDWNGAVSYTWVKDCLNNTFTADTEQKGVIVSSFDNFSGYKYMQIRLNWSHNYGIWSPSVSGFFSRQYFDMTYLDKTLKLDGNTWQLSTANSLQIKKNWDITMSYMFSNGGWSKDVSFRPYQNWSLSVTKRLMDGRLSFNFRANDIFHQYYFREHIRNRRVDFSQTEDYKLWYYRIGVTFRFNKRKSSYSGENAAESEMNRI